MNIPDASSPRSIRLLIVVGRMDVGGVPEHIMTLVSGLRHCGYEITIMCRWVHERYHRKLADLGIPIEEFPLQRLPNPIFDLIALIKIARRMSEARFDIVNTHTTKATLIGCIAAKFAGVPLVVNTAHNLGFFAMQNAVTRRVFWLYDKVLSAWTMDKVIMVSQTIRRAAIEQNLFPASKVQYICNGIDRDSFEESARTSMSVRTELAIPPDHAVLITVGRLVWFKGLDTLIDAAKILVDRGCRFTLVLVGDGELKGELGEQSSRLGLSECVLFTGERNDVNDLLNASDIFVLPSVSEGMPITILEAMLQPLPVVASRVGGIPELVDDGNTGLLFPSGDEEALAAVLISLVDDPGKRKAMAEEGYRRVTGEFSAQRMVHETNSFYRSLIGSNDEILESEVRHA